MALRPSIKAHPQAGGVRSPPALILTHLSKTFGGQKALDNAALTIAAGEVHGLLGQNGSGKSTLIKILAGFHAPDTGGTLSIAGETAPMPLAPGAFRRYRIAFVHQHLGLVPSLTVTENMLVNALATEQRWRIHWPRERRRVASLFERFGIAISPSAEVWQLPPVERALLAIIRAVDEIEATAGEGLGNGILILDEPTPFLPRRDVEQLFGVVRNVVRGGAGVVFVSHDVDEVMEITDRATVLRDGHVAGTLVTRDASKTDFIQMIIGRKLDAYAKKPATASAGGPATVRIADLSGDIVEAVDITLRAGEVVGLTGLIGSGYDEVPYLVYGARNARAGTLTIDNRTEQLASASPANSIDRGIVLIPADRPTQGVIGQLATVDNITMPVLSRIFRAYALDRRAMTVRARELGARFEVVPNRPDLPLSAYSGGNQQKIVLAKWLQQAPKLILLDEPTQGVDVGARQTVYRHIEEAAVAGAAVICASSDYEQLEAICDRVLIFSGGRIGAELSGDAITKPNIAERALMGVGTSLMEAIT